MIFCEDMFLNVIKSVMCNGCFIILIVILVFIFVYMFFIIGYLFFKDDFLIEIDLILFFIFGELRFCNFL